MSPLVLTKTRLFEGVWEGVLRYESDAGPDPKIDVTFQDKPVVDVDMTFLEKDQSWAVRIPLPPESLSDGVHTILVSDASSGTRLDKITFIAGEALADDLRAELDLLRAELDMLKRAFRRHCVETM